MKEKYDSSVGEFDDLKNSIIQKHMNDFKKGLRQAAFFHQDVDITDSKFDVNKDVVDGKLVQEDKGSANEETVEEEKKAGDAEEVAPVAAE